MSGLVGAQSDVTPMIHHSKTMDLDAGSALHSAAQCCSVLGSPGKTFN